MAVQNPKHYNQLRSSCAPKTTLSIIKYSMKVNLTTQEITPSKIPIPHQTLLSASEDLKLMIVDLQLDTMNSIHCLP